MKVTRRQISVEILKDAMRVGWSCDVQYVQTCVHNTAGMFLCCGNLWK